MQECFVAIGVVFLMIVASGVGVALHDTELVMHDTFIHGVVVVDENHTYNCKPDKRTIELARLRKEIKSLNEQN